MIDPDIFEDFVKRENSTKKNNTRFNNQININPFHNKGDNFMKKSALGKLTKTMGNFSFNEKIKKNKSKYFVIILF